MGDMSAATVKNYTVMQKLANVILIGLLLFMRIQAETKAFSFPLFVVMLSSVCVFAVVDSILLHFGYFNKSVVFNAVKLIELIAYFVFYALVPIGTVMAVVLMLAAAIVAEEFIVSSSDYDRLVIFSREMGVCVVAVISAGISYAVNNEIVWVGVLISIILCLLSVFFHVAWQLSKVDYYEHELSEIKVKIEHLSDSNKKLSEYQEKIRQVNEEINYQKVELKTAMKSLEQLNTESNSQKELMKTLVASFDVKKCVSTTINTIMEVKKPKLAAIYLEEGSCRNKHAMLYSETDYTKMDERLKADADRIFESVKKTKGQGAILTGGSINTYEFVGENDIKALAILPIGSDKVYGMLVIASNKDTFFDQGLNFYEAVMAEFDISVKNIVLYMKTEDMARRDGLTGIYNRLYFGQLFGETVETIKKEGKPLAVALFDIDKFKNVNDTYGHLAGDEVIKLVAHTAEKYSEVNGGFAARYGGEEFLVILPGYDENTALPVLKGMHEEIKATIVDTGKYKINVDCSIGLTAYPGLCDNPDILVSRADKAMYYSKRHGRGQLIIDSPMLDEEKEEE